MEAELSTVSIVDNVHGVIHVPRPLDVVVDTRPLQRLRHIHQMGMAGHVFPTAVHTRFEHSLG